MCMMLHFVNLLNNNTFTVMIENYSELEYNVDIYINPSPSE